LFADTFDLGEHLLRTLARRTDPLSLAIAGHALRLLEHVTLALKNRDRAARLEAADDTLVALRVELRLALRLCALTEAEGLRALETSDRIGRQIGGWLRALGPA
jgi:hypothetical protein